MSNNSSISVDICHCVVPENIHTPTMEELEIPEGLGGGGSKTQEIPEGKGLDNQLSFQMSSIQYRFKCRSSCSKILSYLLN